MKSILKRLLLIFVMSTVLMSSQGCDGHPADDLPETDVFTNKRVIEIPNYVRIFCFDLMGKRSRYGHMLMINRILFIFLM